MFAIYRRSVLLTLTVATGATLAACGSLDNASNSIVGMVTPYKVEIVQGNFVSKEQVGLLRQGMSRVQVRDLLGSPLLTSIFHADRWDYVFTIKRQGVQPQARHLTLFFQGDALQRFEGDDMPSEAEFVAQLDSRRKASSVPLLQASEEAMKDFAARQPVTAAPPMPAAPVAASYPPLESPAR